MAAAFENKYNLRTVADSASKSCFVCQKSTTKVLITPDNKDFLYTCVTHLTDHNFAVAVVDEKAEAEKRKQESLQKEKELIIKEYEEKLKRKKGEKKGWFGFGGSSDKKDEGKNEDDKDEEKKIEDEKNTKLKAVDAKSTATSTNTNDGPKQYTLHRSFYQIRLNRRQEMERAKQQQARVSNPSFFPAVPKGNLT